jgi:hypothetical protein
LALLFAATLAGRLAIAPPRLKAEAVDLYSSREAAEDALRQVLADEPEFAELLSIAPVDLSGTPASPTTC